METQRLNIKLDDTNWRVGNFSYAKELVNGQSDTLAFRVGLTVSNLFRSMFGFSKHVLCDGIGSEGGLVQYVLLKSEVDQLLTTLASAHIPRPIAATQRSSAPRVVSPQEEGVMAFERKLEEASVKVSAGEVDRDSIFAPFGGELSFLKSCVRFAEISPRETEAFNERLLEAQNARDPAKPVREAEAHFLEMINAIWSYKQE